MGYTKDWDGLKIGRAYAKPRDGFAGTWDVVPLKKGARLFYIKPWPKTRYSILFWKKYDLWDADKQKMVGSFASLREALTEADLRLNSPLFRLAEA